MMKSPSLLAAAVALLAPPCLDGAFAFTTSSRTRARAHQRGPRIPTILCDGAADATTADPETSYFQMQQIPTATSGEKLDRVVECSDHGGCDVEEMMNMIDELERLNAECQNAMSRECNLDAVAARNVLKVALASKVAMEDALTKEQREAEEACADGVEDNPYAMLADMEDECQLNYLQHQQLPSATSSAKLDRIVECAEGSAEGCDYDEMMEMVDELEKLNMECEGALSRECSLDAVAARNILKVALASKAIQ